jgi:hypothetical protein
VPCVNAMTFRMTSSHVPFCENTCLIILPVRTPKKKLFLRTDELLILVLHLVKRAMLNSHMGGFADLHIPHSRETGAWDGILDLFRDKAVGGVKDPLGLADASNVESVMKTLSESGVECSAENEINPVLNPQHLELRQCLENLREEVGWVVEARQMLRRHLTYRDSQYAPAGLLPSVRAGVAPRDP